MVQHSYLVWVNITGQIRGCVQVFFQALLLGLVLVNSNIHQADDDEEQGNDEHGPLSLMMYHYLPIENGEQSFHVRKCIVWHSMFAVCPVFPGCSVQEA
jgi:hypothetical protein